MQPVATRLSRSLAVGAGVIATGIGAAGLLGLFDNGPPPDGVGYGPGSVRPETGLALGAAGVGLVLLAGSPGRPRRRIGRVLGAFAAAVALLGMIQNAVPGLDRVPYPRPDPLPLTPMTPAAAAALFLAGASIATLDLSRGRRPPWSHVLAPAGCALAMVTALAYGFKTVDAEPGIAGLIAMPLPTAGGVLLLTAGALLARPDGGLLRPFGSLGPGGAFARRLAPTLALVPLGIVGLSVVVIRLGSGDPAIVFSLCTALFVLVAVLMLGSTVRVVDEADVRRGRLIDELAAERDFTAILFQSLSEAVVVFDRDRRVVDVNPHACRLLGLPRAGLVGQRPPYTWQPAVGPLTYGDAEPDGEPDRNVRRPDGALIPVLARMSPIPDADGRPRAFVATYVDMTAHKRAEEVLGEHAADLERANDLLRESNERLEQAAEFKSDLMSIVSHEVSQPLSSVASLAELLASDWADLPDDVRLELSTKIDKNARRLTRLIKDMLLLFRLDAGAVSARRGSVPIGEVIETVAESLPAAAHIVTVTDPDVCVLADRGHLWQVLNNLVSNAITYGRPPIEIRVEQRPDGVVISVRDHGPGIPEERLPKLFDRITRRQGGGTKVTGLGLFIVRHLVEVNGGTIWYEPAEPTGANLLIRMEPAPQPTASAQSASPTPVPA